MELPVIEASGTPYEIGYTHGSRAKEQIAVNIGVYKAMFMEYAGIGWEKAKKTAESFEGAIRDFNPKYLDEIRGIADGSGFEYEEILALNVRSELVFQGTNLTTDGCTSMAVTADRSRDGNNYIGQNWDWKAKIQDGVILLKIRQEGMPDISVMTEAGIIGKIGCNSAGIGLCFNALSVDDTPHGVPLHIILRAILEQDDFTEAMEVVTQNEIGCPANIMIAGKYGEAIDFEVGIGDFDAFYPSDGLLVHTNHYRSLRVPKYNQKDLAKCRFPDTFIRLGRAEYLAGKMTDISADDMKKIFTDHTDPGCSICHHPKTADDIGTVFNIIMNLNEGTFYVSFGRPCGNVYKKYYA